MGVEQQGWCEGEWSTASPLLCGLVAGWGWLPAPLCHKLFGSLSLSLTRYLIVSKLVEWLRGGWEWNSMGEVGKSRALLSFFFCLPSSSFARLISSLEMFRVLWRELFTGSVGVIPDRISPYEVNQMYH